jgi:hypothetical protein
VVRSGRLSEAADLGGLVGIHVVDQVSEHFLELSTADLPSWCGIALFWVEFLWDYSELLDLLYASEFLITFGYLAVEQCTNLGKLREARKAGEEQTTVFAPSPRPSRSQSPRGRPGTCGCQR